MQRVSLGLLATLGCLAAARGSSAPDRPVRASAELAPWQSEANRICRDARSDAERIGGEFATDAAGTIGYLRALNRSFVEFVAELRRVDVPGTHRVRYAEMTDRYQDALDAQEELLSALEAGDMAAAERHDAAVAARGDGGDRIALELSLDECALDPGETEPFTNSP